MTSARADPESAAAFAEGQRLYGEGKYIEAAEQFAIAYEQDHDPAHLYNIAQAYRSGHACAKAAEAYRKFQQAVQNPPEPENLRSLIDEMDGCANRTEPKPVIEVAPARLPPPRETPDPTPRRTPTVAIVLGIAGLVALGAAGYFTWSAHDLQNQRNELCTTDKPCDWMGGERAEELDDLDRRGNRNAKLAIAGYAVGGVAILTGLALYLFTGNDDRDRQTTVVTTPGGALVATGWSF